MKFFLTFFLFAGLNASAQVITDESNSEETLLDEHQEIPSYRYVSLKDNKVFDVEIIVFAYLNPLPNNKTYTNKPIFDDSNAIELDMKPEDLSFQVKEESNESENLNNNTELTVSIDGSEEEDTQVLVWFEHNLEQYELLPIWERLQNQSHIVPLLHKAWRQPETPFDAPQYVKLSNIMLETEQDETNEAPFSESEDAVLNNNKIVENNIDSEHFGIFLNRELKDSLEFSQQSKMYYSDFSVTGSVALSQGRYLHFGHLLNLFRLAQDADTKAISNMVFSLEERRRLEADGLHYFDSPWFGSIVKITPYKGEVEATSEKTGTD